jgi:hypothetical protein
LSKKTNFIAVLGNGAGYSQASRDAMPNRHLLLYMENNDLSGKSNGDRAREVI